MDSRELQINLENSIDFFEGYFSGTSDPLDLLVVKFPGKKKKIVVWFEGWRKSDRIRIYDFETREIYRAIETTSSIYSVVVYRHFLVSGERYGKITFWNSQNDFAREKTFGIGIERVHNIHRKLLSFPNMFLSASSFNSNLLGYPEGVIFRITNLHLDYPWGKDIYKERIFQSNGDLTLVLSKTVKSVLYIALSRRPYTIQKLDFLSGEVISEFSVNRGSIMDMKTLIAEDGEERLVATSLDNSLIMWSLDGEILHNIPRGPNPEGHLDQYLSLLHISRGVFFMGSINGRFASIDVNTGDSKLLFRIPGRRIYCMKWISKESENDLIFCAGASRRVIMLFRVDLGDFVMERKDMGDMCTHLQYNAMNDEQERDDRKERIQYLIGNYCEIGFIDGEKFKYLKFLIVK